MASSTISVAKIYQTGGAGQMAREIIRLNCGKLVSLVKSVSPFRAKGAGQDRGPADESSERLGAILEIRSQAVLLSVFGGSPLCDVNLEVKLLRAFIAEAHRSGVPLDRVELGTDVLARGSRFKKRSWKSFLDGFIKNEGKTEALEHLAITAGGKLKPSAELVRFMDERISSYSKEAGTAVQ